MRSEESQTVWISCRRSIHVILVAAVVMWSAYWDGMSTRIATRFSRQTSAWLVPLLFWIVPIVGVFSLHLVLRYLDKTFLQRRWTGVDLLRLAGWSTVAPYLALVILALAFDMAYAHQWSGILLLPVAGVVALVGRNRLLHAAGMKPRPVRFGYLHGRAFDLAKKMGVKLRQVNIVPAGKGRLTNAFSFGPRIAVTDNYGKWLDRKELDFVIAHELAHTKQRHSVKTVVAMTILVTGLWLTMSLLPSSRPTYGAPLNIGSIFATILAGNFISRRFEYEADRIALSCVRDPAIAIQALESLDRATGVPLRFNRVFEAFLAHPATSRRTEAIARFAGEQLAKNYPGIAFK